MFFPKIISKPGLKIASIIDLLFSRRIRTCPLWREPNLRAADQSREHPSIRAGEIQLFPSSSPTSSARPRSRRSLTFYARVSPLWFLTAPNLVLLPLLWSLSGGIGILELVHLFPNASGSPRTRAPWALILHWISIFASVRVRLLRCRKRPRRPMLRRCALTPLFRVCIRHVDRNNNTVALKVKLFKYRGYLISDIINLPIKTGNIAYTTHVKEDVDHYM